jgi:hypothetical protein
MDFMNALCTLSARVDRCKKCNRPGGLRQPMASQASWFFSDQRPLFTSKQCHCDIIPARGHRPRSSGSRRFSSGGLAIPSHPVSLRAADALPAAWQSPPHLGNHLLRWNRVCLQQSNSKAMSECGKTFARVSRSVGRFGGNGVRQHPKIFFFPALGRGLGGGDSQVFQLCESPAFARVSSYCIQRTLL